MNSLPGPSRLREDRLAGLRPGDGPLSGHARPYSLEHACDLRATSTGKRRLVNVPASCLTLERNLRGGYF